MALFEAVNVIVEPEGASSGTLSQAAVRADPANSRQTPVRRQGGREPDRVGAMRGIIVNPLTILIS
jgi:hypothetical protein